MLRRRLLLLVVAALSLASLGLAWQSGRADLASAASRARVRHWLIYGDTPTPAEWLGTVRNLEAVQQIEFDPTRAESLAFLYALRADQLGAYPAVADALRETAAGQLQAALGGRPMSPYAWANLARLRQQRGAAAGSVLAAYDRAFAYGRREPGVQLILARVAAALWEDLGAPRRAAWPGLVAGADPVLRPQLLALLGARLGGEGG